MQLQEPAERPT